MFKSYRVGRIFGIPIELDVTLLLILPVFAWLIATQIEQLVPVLNATLGTEMAVESLTSGARPWLIGFVVAVGLFIGVALHELGHSLTAMSFGYRIESITLWLLGGVARFVEHPRNWWHEFWIAIAGPIVSVGIGVTCYVALVVYSPGSDVLAFILSYLAVLNIALALFNMLPAFPLDGGRVFRSILARSQPYEQATQRAAAVGQVFALVLGVIGLLALNLFWMAIAFFIFVAAAAESRSVTLDAALHGLRVGDLMTSADSLSTVPPDLQLDRLLDRMLRERHTGFPVVDEDGTLVGIVTLEDIQEINTEKRSDAIVADVMTSVDEIITVSPDTDAVDAVRLFGQHGVGRLLVVDEIGNLMGILTRTDVMTALSIVQERQRIEKQLHRPA